MDQAKMARDDQQDTPDDLIAELARLMAEDAQGDKGQTGKPETKAEPEAEAEAAPAGEGPEPAASPIFPADHLEAEAPSKTGAPEPFFEETAEPEPSHHEAQDTTPVQAGFTPPTHEDTSFSAQDEEEQADDIFARLAAQLETIEKQVSGAAAPVSSHPAPQPQEVAEPETDAQDHAELGAAPAHDAEDGFPQSEEAGVAYGHSGDQAAPEEIVTDDHLTDDSAEQENAVPENLAQDYAVHETVEAVAEEPEDDTFYAPDASDHDDPIADLIAADGEPFEDDESPDFPYEEEVAEEPVAGDHAAVEDWETVADETVAPVSDVPVQNAPQDNFSVSPVLGLGGAKPAPAPEAAQQQAVSQAASEDPIDEIEALIGEAVKSGWGSQTPEPAESEPDSDVDHAVQAVEAAIDAAQRSGQKTAPQHARGPQPAQAPASNAGFGDAEALAAGAALGAAATREDEAPAGGLADTLRAYRIPLALGVVLLLGVGAGAWYFTRSGTGSGTAPLLASNTQGAKVEATNTTESGNDQQSIVFNQLSDNSSSAAATGSEQLVSRDQSTAAPATSDTQAAGTAGDTVRKVGEGASQSTDTAVAAATSDTGEMTLTNRKVRTVTVRPDGTIVSDDASVAGNQELGVARPNVPAVPGGDTSQNFQVASAETAGTATQTTTPSTTTDTATTNTATAADGTVVANAPYPAPRLGEVQRVQLASAERSAALASAATSAATASSSGTSSNTNAVDLLAGVANQSVSNTQTAAAPASTTTTTTTAPTDGVQAPAYVQLSSQRALDAANTTLDRMTQRFKDQLGDATAFVRKVDLGDKGTFYRVLVPAASVEAANGLCTNIKNAGGDCFVRTQ